MSETLDQLKDGEPPDEREPALTDGAESEPEPEPTSASGSEPAPTEGGKAEAQPAPAEGSDTEPVEPPELDPEVKARRDAALAHVRKFGDPVLKTKAREVERFDDALRQEVERLGMLMNDAMGIGLAATQIGLLNRVFVYRVQPDAPPSALVNPEVRWSSSEEETAEEGCLSLPLVHVDVERPVHVRVEAKDERGEPLVVEASGLEARVILHELDHLDGVLILSRTTREQRKEAMRLLRAQQPPA